LLRKIIRAYFRWAEFINPFRLSRKHRKALGYGLLFSLVLSLASCQFWPFSWGKPNWPIVEPLAAPKLPAWIQQVSPLGDNVEPLSQILIRFQSPLIPLEALDSPQQQELLQKFEIKPTLPGHFRFLTPQMVGFQSDAKGTLRARALPKATRVQITLKNGLQDLKKHHLEQDLAWTFSTETLQIKDLPGVVEGDNSNPDPIDLHPTLSFQANTELDLESLRSHTQLIPQGETKTVALTINRKVAESDKNTDTPDAQSEFDPARQTWEYTLQPKFDLQKATTYRLQIEQGLKPVQGNLATTNTFSSQVKTYGDLAYEKIEPYGQPDSGGAYGRFVKGSPQLKFNNPLIAKTALTLKPEPKQGIKAVRAYDNDNYISLNPYALEPNTHYEITVDPSLKDKFGQTLGKKVTIPYDTGDISPDIWAPSGLNIFPQSLSQNLRLNLSTVNLPDRAYRAAYQVVQPTDLVFTDSASPGGTDKDLLPKVKAWQSYAVKQPPNQTQEQIIPLTEKLGAETGMIAYGFRAKTNEYQENGKTAWREPEYYGLVQLTNLGVFAQWFPQSGQVKVNHLSDGSRVEKAQVEIYRSQLEAKQKNAVQPCAIATTDALGMAKIEGEQWQNCVGAGKAPQLLVIVKEGTDWAFTRTDEYSGAYEYGIAADWTEEKPLAKGEIFSDRRLYQPGETAWFTANAVYLDQGTLQQDQGTVYNLSLTYPDGKIEKLGTATSNEFGTFSFKVDLKKNQSLGYYSLQAKNAKGGSLSGEFQVAEFKPPTFKVDVSLDQAFALAGQSLTIKTDSQYLFGAPVQNGEVKYYVTREKIDISPKNWENFSFGLQWFWPEEPPQVANEVMQEMAQLDSQGLDQRSLKIAADLPFPMQYRVEAQVQDVSRLSVSAVQTFTALTNNHLIGLQSDFVANAGQKFPVKLIVTDVQGNVIANQKVRLELQRMDYSNVSQLTEGSATNHPQIQYQTVAKQEITSAAEPMILNLTPPNGGSYRIQANFVESDNDATATDLQIWATGTGEINWDNRYDNNRLSLSLDKKTYQVGETATVLLQSPYPEADLYFAVVRDRPLYSLVQKVTGSAPKIQFPITAEMLPNAAVEAVLVRRGQLPKDLDKSSGDKLVKIGFAPFNLNLANQYLQVKVTPAKPKLSPKSSQSVQLNLTNAQGQPVAGQITLMAVNDAVLQLSGYRPPDLVKTIYSDQPITTRLADNRPQVVLAQMPSPLEKGWGYGGGQSQGLADTVVRRHFQPLAYYEGSVLTNAQGQAQVTFSLPDDLTIWRVMALATDGNLHFGQAESTFITTKPLVTNAVLPLFARLRDRFLGGVAVSNLTQKTGTLHLQGDVNDKLQFPEKSGRSVKAPQGTAAYRFPITAVQAGEGEVKFASQLDQFQDAFAVPLTVENLAFTEQVITSGTTENTVKIPLKLQATAEGSLEINLASNLLPTMLLPAQTLLAKESLPFLEAAASQLSMAANLQRLVLAGASLTPLTGFSLAERATQSLDILQSLQKPDGGFSSYPDGKKSDPFLTPDAAIAISQAQTAGFTVNRQMVANLKTYLAQLLANPAQSDGCASQACKNSRRLDSLMALAALGDQRQDFLATLYEQRLDLDRVDQIKLARYLAQFPQWQRESQSLTETIQRSLYETGRNARINLPEQWRNSPTTAQAQALQLFLAQRVLAQGSSTENRDPLLDRLLKGLLDQRRAGIWPNGYDNAQALTALLAYHLLETEPSNFQISVELDGKILGKGQFQGLNTKPYSLSIVSPNLPKTQKELVLKKSGQGKLHYLTAYRYRLPGNQPGRLNGLRVTRYLHPANETTVLAQQDLAIANQPITVQTGQVFDLELEIITDHPLDHLLITDPLPAGLEAIDSSLQTAPQYQQAQGSNWEINYQQIHRDQVVASSDRLEAGVYHLHYLVRSVTPGLFDWPGAEAHLQYAPEVFGRCASAQLEVKE